jgi:hypothetical protein
VSVDVYKLRSIKPSPQAIVEYGTDRKKALQTGALMRVRAMRSVLLRSSS